MALGDLEVKGNTNLVGTLAVGGTVDLNGGAADTDLVTNLNADKVDSADLDTDGTLAADSDVKIPSQKAVKTYADTNKVAMTGDQTVAGIKTLSSIPVLPASDPTTDNQAARKAYVDGLDAANVKLTGDQTVVGVKTFSNLLRYSTGLRGSGGISSDANPTENAVFDYLATYLPNISDTIHVWGGGKSGTDFAIIDTAYRVDADTIRLTGIVVTTGAAFSKDCDDGDATVAFSALHISL